MAFIMTFWHMSTMHLDKKYSSLSTPPLFIIPFSPPTSLVAFFFILCTYESKHAVIEAVHQAALNHSGVK